jgi:hypothetical protein
MLINMIGTDEEHVADFETWKSEPFSDPTSRETLSMAVQAAVASFAVGPTDAPARERIVAPLGTIATQGDVERTSRVDAA